MKTVGDYMAREEYSGITHDKVFCVFDWIALASDLKSCLKEECPSCPPSLFLALKRITWRIFFVIKLHSSNKTKILVHSKAVTV